MVLGGEPAFRDCARACTSAVALPVLKSMTAEVPPVSGEMAPLKAKTPGGARTPAWRRLASGPRSSYQRTIERPPGPLTVCWVQIASAPAAEGSAWATAWVGARRGCR